MIVVVGHRGDLVLAAVTVVVTDEASLEMLFDRYLRSGCQKQMDEHRAGKTRRRSRRCIHE